jgi:cytochrome P450
MTAEERELPSRSLRREVNERIAQLIEGFHVKAEEPVMTVFCECGSEECMAPIELNLAEYQAVRAGPTRWVISSAHIDTTADSIIARRNGYALIEHAPDLLSPEAPSPRKGANIASDESLVRTLILLLAACEQTTRELKRTDAKADGLGEELETLSARLHDLLGQDR